MRKLAEQTVAELAYIAGFLDADGSFGLYQHNGTLVARVSVSNTDMGVLEWLQEHLGGAIYHDVGQKRKKEWKARAQWIITGQPACDVARAVEPFLVVKPERARLMREGWETRAPTPRGSRVGRGLHSGNGPVDPVAVTRRASYVERLRILNRKGPPPDEAVERVTNERNGRIPIQSGPRANNVKFS